jgi:hypothetical protein
MRYDGISHDHECVARQEYFFDYRDRSADECAQVARRRDPDSVKPDFCNIGKRTRTLKAV